jgi:hypothetical protein
MAGRGVGLLARLTAVYDRSWLTQKGVHCAIDRLREQTQQLGEQLDGVAQSRRVLVSLDPRSKPAPALAGKQLGDQSRAAGGS